MSETPIRNKLLLKARSLNIPPSPQMQKLGYGTGVTVYKLERSENRSPWVLKKISRKIKRPEEMSVRLNFEASILKMLKHPNIVGFRALLQESDGRRCIAMENCDISLGDMIENRVDNGDNTPFPASSIFKVVRDIAQGLNYLHNEALVLHCDMKSYNILIKNNFEICKICDFGVSMPLKADGTLDYSKAGEEPEYVGTEPWFPPEVLQEGQIITVKADIFSYGLCVWEMIALETPYSNETDSVGGDSEDDKENSVITILDSDEDVGKDEKDLQSTIKMRERPKVPCEYLDDSYLPVLQVYYLCTEQDYRKRPSAKDLCAIIDELKI